MSSFLLLREINPFFTSPKPVDWGGGGDRGGRGGYLKRMVAFGGGGEGRRDGCRDAALFGSGGSGCGCCLLSDSIGLFLGLEDFGDFDDCRGGFPGAKLHRDCDSVFFRVKAGIFSVVSVRRESTGLRRTDQSRGPRDEDFACGCTDLLGCNLESN